MSLSIIAFSARPSQAEFLISSLTCVVGGFGDQDCEAPTTPDNLAAGTYQSSNDFQLSWNASDDASTVTYKLCVATNGSFSGQTCTDELSDTSYAANSLIPNKDAAWYWRVMATDTSDNKSGWSETKQVAIDTTDPIVTLSADSLVIGGNVPTSILTGGVSDDSLSRYELTITDSSGAVVDILSQDVDDSSVDISHAWNVVDPTRLPSGTYIGTLIATDKAGRTGSGAVTIEVDNTGPTLTISGGDVIIKEGSIAPGVAVEDPRGVVSYTWSADASNPAPIDVDTSAKEPTFTPTVEGSYIFKLTARDGFGNESSDLFQFGYKVELAPLPLPTETTTGASDSTPLPTAVSPTSTSTRSARDEAIDDETVSQVLGTTNSSGGDPALARQTAALSSTQGGWSILGILWYWWAAIIAGILAVSLIIRRFFMPRLIQKP